jgi:WD40 repeat protein
VANSRYDAAVEIQKDFKLKLTGHDLDVLSMRIFSDPIKKRTLLITTSCDRTAIVWDLESGLKYRTFRADDWLRDCQLLNHNVNGVVRLIAIIAGDDESAIVWDVDGDAKLYTFYHSGFVYTLDIIPSLFVYGDSPTPIALAINTQPDDKLARRRVSGFGLFQSQDCREINNAVISGSEAGEVCVWDINTGKQIEYKQVIIQDVDHDEDDDDDYFYYNTGASSIVEDIDDDINVLLSLPVANKRNRVLIASDSGMWMYDISSLPATRMKKFMTDGEKIYYLDLTTQSNRPCVVGSGYAESRSITVWDLETTETIFKLKCTQKITCSTVFKVREDDSTPTVIAGCVDGQLVLWDEESGHNRPRSLPGVKDEIDYVAVYKDLSSNLPVLISTAEGVIYVSLLGEDDSKITSSRKFLQIQLITRANLACTCI